MVAFDEPARTFEELEESEAALRGVEALRRGRKVDRYGGVEDALGSRPKDETFEFGRGRINSFHAPPPIPVHRTSSGCRRRELREIR
jgi:hypothetical protein